MKTKLLLNSGKLALLILVSFLISCKGQKDKQPDSNISYSEELAKEISFVTNGDIHFNDVIQVVFNDAVVEESDVNASPKDVFSFSPSIKGQAVWVSQSVLEFKPDRPLPTRESFDGKLDLQKLSSKFKEKELEDLIFRINIIGRDLANYKASITLKDRNNPILIAYGGTVSFTEKTDLETLEKAASIKGDATVRLIWSKIDDKTFKFTTNDIERTNKTKNFKVIIDKKPLDLEYNFTETFTVSPLEKMVPNDFRTDEAGRSPRMRVSFSDELDMDQNIEGLISVSPSVKFEVKKLGKAVVLDGDFKFGQEYSITIEKGIRSRWGTKTDVKTTQKLKFSDIQPQLEFASDGIILPSSNKNKIQFYTTNLKRVHLQVKKVYTKQIGTFIQSQQLTSTKTRNKTFNDSYSSAVGVIVKSQTIELGDKQNEWVLNEFDLTELFSKYDDGLFLLGINFTPEDVSLPIKGEILDYIYEKGQIYKPIFLSNIGITAKEADDETKVFVTDIVTGKPLSSVKVSLLDWEGDERTSDISNSQGAVTFNSDYYYYYIKAEKGSQVSVLNKNEMRWSTSGFDVGGVRENRRQSKGFIYTERGVYRPGDSINVGFIVRNHDNTFPGNHPVSISVSDPQYNTIFTQTTSEAIDGLYTFGFATDENAPTGNYNVRINAGGSQFYHDLKIETVVAEQLKVQIKPLKKQVLWTDKSIDFELNASYLFGAPAANLKSEVVIEIHPYTMQFPKFSEFFFSRSDVEFKSFTQNALKKNLDAEGKLTGSWVIPTLGTVPSALKAKIIGKVTEKGGQTNEGWNVVDMHVYPNYVGIKDPSGYGYHTIGQEVKFPVMLTDVSGKRISGKQLEYRIYRNDKQWWYQYDNRRNYQLKYKEDSQTYLEASGSVSIQEGPSYIAFTPAENGHYLIEVSDGGSGHSASIFFSAYRYGGIPAGDLNEGTLALKSDKDKYKSSDRAKIMLPNPKQGNILVTVEKGREIIDWFWVDPSNSKNDELVIDVPLSKKMLPNAYVTVSVIQPHNQTQNDRPIRMFGIIPIMIEDSDTRIDFTIETAENLTPNNDFEVKISTLNQKQAHFTIAVVDEGLLSLTQFRTPNPWREFYKKVGLYIETYDVFSHIISANKGDVFQTFSIGGADDMDYRESQLDPVDGKKRFKPVCMFKGPLSTDDRGRATVKFHMPNYNGAVRIMVVGTNKGSFGSVEKTVPVRSDIIMQPSIPRILKPGDEFTLPVALFRINPKITNAQFKFDTEGPIEVVGDKIIKVDFGQNDEADIKFKVRVKEAVGQAKIVLTGVSGSTEVKSETDIKVVPSSVRVYDKSTEKIEKGQTQSIKVPKVGLDGTNNASLDLNIFPNMDFDHRLKWLIRYPYGCIEQSTSTLFPQLYLKKMGYFQKDEIAEIDRNLNEGINRLQTYIVSSGGFAYWPGNTTECDWGTNYATHFMIEAKKLGYSVPDYMYNGAINRLKSAARNHSGKLTTRVNRAFVLALAQQQPMAEMNLLMENELKNMNSAEKWMLAAAYHLAGAENIRDQILSNTDTVTKEYEPFSYNFGSKYRDDAIILYAAVLMNQLETAELMAKGVAANLSSREYLSTQSSGYMLLALGKYFDVSGISAAQGQIISGTVKLANGQTIDFNQAGRITIPIRDNFGQDIQVTISNSTKVDVVYASVAWNGVPLKDESKAFENNLSLKVNWYDEDGNTLNPQSLKQGATFYGRFSVKNTSPLSRVSELALVQVLPSGWQIENIRINNTLLPDWTRGWSLNKENYLDIRDDRVMWFFDLKDSETLDFVVKLNCINAGEFWLPGTLLEAMYSKDFKATTVGTKVYVKAFE
ncbi:MAG: MG2 domain-containing protein [Bacteroidales bacterium]|nr:MG2 domain-containing protein [Bacteroidales bacterium]